MSESDTGAGSRPGAIQEIDHFANAVSVAIDDPRFEAALRSPPAAHELGAKFRCATGRDGWRVHDLNGLAMTMSSAGGKPRNIKFAEPFAGKSLRWRFYFDSAECVTKVEFNSPGVDVLCPPPKPAKEGVSPDANIKDPSKEMLLALAKAGETFEAAKGGRWALTPKAATRLKFENLIENPRYRAIDARRYASSRKADKWHIKFKAGGDDHDLMFYTVEVPQGHPFNQGQVELDLSPDTDLLPEQFVADVAALATYEPRKKAIRWILEGQVDRYLKWELSDGRQAATGRRPARPTDKDRLAALFAPMELDEQLIGARLPDPYERMRTIQAGRLAEAAHDHFLESPFEIALRSADDASFEKMLDAIGRPSHMALGAIDMIRGASWSFAFPIRSSVEDFFNSRERLGSRGTWDVLVLAFLIGRPERAEAMVRKGLCPRDAIEWDVAGERMLRLSKVNADVLADLAKVDKVNERDLKAARDWALDNMSSTQDRQRELAEKRGEA